MDFEGDIKKLCIFLVDNFPDDIDESRPDWDFESAVDMAIRLLSEYKKLK